MFSANRKILHIFYFISEGKQVQGWNYCMLVEAEKWLIQNILIKKVLKFEGSIILRYGVISDWKMKFLHSVIEKFSVFYKNLYYRWGFFENFSHLLIEVINR